MNAFWGLLGLVALLAGLAAAMVRGGHLSVTARRKPPRKDNAMPP